MSNTLKEVIGFTLLVIALGFSFFISAKVGYSNLFPKKEEIQEEQPVIVKDIVCPDNQYKEDGVCKDIVYVCPQGERVTDKTRCPLNIETSSTSTKTATGSQISIEKPTTSTTSTASKNPVIKNVTITKTTNGITVAISGTNFDKKVNTIMLSSQGELIEKMTFPSYPGPNNTQTINFRMNDFREHYANKYSFQISAKGVVSNVFGVNE